MGRVVVVWLGKWGRDPNKMDMSSLLTLEMDTVGGGRITITTTTITTTISTFVICLNFFLIKI